MIYDVRQTIAYSYASGVGYARHVLRLNPIDRSGQRVHLVAMDIDPPPMESREGRDFFGNRLTWITLDAPHDRLSIKVAARIVVEPGAPPPASETPPWESVRDAAFATADLRPESPVHFLFGSRQASLDPEITDYTRASFSPERRVLDGALDLMHRIKADFTYDTDATTATTTPPMSFALRRGVCQDFAHVMIAGLRGLGLPAAYVSGYLRTAPRNGSGTLLGADAMHAWVMAWCGQTHGWQALDPTNDVRAGDDHIVVAIGRDYADVAPVDGVVFASGGQEIDVAVNVIPVGA